MSPARSRTITRDLLVGSPPCTAEKAGLPLKASMHVVTALDLPVDDHSTHFIGACRLVTAQHTDCGLIWCVTLLVYLITCIQSLNGLLTQG